MALNHELISNPQILKLSRHLLLYAESIGTVSEFRHNPSDLLLAALWLCLSPKRTTEVPGLQVSSATQPESRVYSCEENQGNSSTRVAGESPVSPTIVSASASSHDRPKSSSGGTTDQQSATDVHDTNHLKFLLECPLVQVGNLLKDKTLPAHYTEKLRKSNDNESVISVPEADGAPTELQVAIGSPARLDSDTGLHHDLLLQCEEVEDGTQGGDEVQSDDEDMGEDLRPREEENSAKIGEENALTPASGCTESQTRDRDASPALVEGHGAVCGDMGNNDWESCVNQTKEESESMVEESSPVPTPVHLASTTTMPNISGATMPNVSGVTMPNVSGVTMPNVSGATIPNVSGATMPNVSGATLPNVSGATLPDVNGATIPNVSGVTMPNVSGATLPDVSEATVLNVSGVTTLSDSNSASSTGSTTQTIASMLQTTRDKESEIRILDSTGNIQAFIDQSVIKEMDSMCGSRSLGDNLLLSVQSIAETKEAVLPKSPTTTDTGSDLPVVAAQDMDIEDGDISDDDIVEFEILDSDSVGSERDTEDDCYFSVSRKSLHQRPSAFDLNGNSVVTTEDDLASQPTGYTAPAGQDSMGGSVGLDERVPKSGSVSISEGSDKRPGRGRGAGKTMAEKGKCLRGRGRHSGKGGERAGSLSRGKKLVPGQGVSKGNAATTKGVAGRGKPMSTAKERAGRGRGIAIRGKAAGVTGKGNSVSGRSGSSRSKGVAPRGRGSTLRGKGFASRGKNIPFRGKGFPSRGKNSTFRGKGFGFSSRGKNSTLRGKGFASRGKNSTFRGKGFASRGRNISDRGRGFTPRGRGMGLTARGNNSFRDNSLARVSSSGGRVSRFTSGGRNTDFRGRDFATKGRSSSLRESAVASRGTGRTRSSSGTSSIRGRGTSASRSREKERSSSMRSKVTGLSSRGRNTVVERKIMTRQSNSTSIAQKLIALAKSGRKTANSNKDQLTGRLALSSGSGVSTRARSRLNINVGPQMTIPQMTTPQMTTPQMTTPQMTTPQSLASSDMGSNDKIMTRQSTGAVAPCNYTGLADSGPNTSDSDSDDSTGGVKSLKSGVSTSASSLLSGGSVGPQTITRQRLTAFLEGRGSGMMQEVVTYGDVKSCKGVSARASSLLSGGSESPQTITHQRLTARLEGRGSGMMQEVVTYGDVESHKSGVSARASSILSGGSVSGGSVGPQTITRLTALLRGRGSGMMQEVVTSGNTSSAFPQKPSVVANSGCNTTVSDKDEPTGSLVLSCESEESGTGEVGVSKANVTPQITTPPTSAQVLQDATHQRLALVNHLGRLVYVPLTYLSLNYPTPIGIGGNRVAATVNIPSTNEGIVPQRNIMSGVSSPANVTAFERGGTTAMQGTIVRQATVGGRAPSLTDHRYSAMGRTLSTFNQVRFGSDQRTQFASASKQTQEEQKAASKTKESHTRNFIDLTEPESDGIERTTPVTSKTPSTVQNLSKLTKILKKAIDKLNDEQTDKSGMDGQTDNSDMDQQTDKSGIDQQTDKSGMDQQTDKLGMDQQTDKSGMDQQTDKSGMDQQTDKSGMDQQTDKSGMDQQTDKSGMDQQTDKSGMDQQTDKSGMDQQTDNSGMDQQTDKSRIDKQTNNSGMDQQSAMANQVDILAMDQHADNSGMHVHEQTDNSGIDEQSGIADQPDKSGMDQQTTRDR